jgi:hypothetical protein
MLDYKLSGYLGEGSLGSYFRIRLLGGSGGILVRETLFEILTP